MIGIEQMLALAAATIATLIGVIGYLLKRDFNHIRENVSDIKNDLRAHIQDEHTTLVRVDKRTASLESRIAAAEGKLDLLISHNKG